MPKFFFGEVIKRSSAKTIKVLVRQMVWNKKIQKRLLRRTKLMTHDPADLAKVGDFVKIRHSGENISKRKAHILDTVVRAAPEA